MADILAGVVICLMAVQTVQVDGNRTRTTNSPQFKVDPKSFRGNICQHNLTKQLSAGLHPSGDPWLDVNPNDAATAYTTGVLSTWILPLSYILAMIVGIPSNAYILAFLRLRLRTKSLSTVVLYLNLALSDLLLLLSLALRVHYHFSGNNWVFGELSCRLMTALFYGNVYCSAQTIACISLKRYFAVVKPFLYRRLAKTAVTVWACLIVWFLFGATIVPELLVRQSYWLDQLGVTTCHDVLPLEEKSHSLLVPYRLVLVCLGFVVPFLISIYAHVSVVQHLGQSGCNWRPFIKISTLVFIIFALFGSLPVFAHF
ncbi:LOW QUALITY PROTEIN: proteinase-activated receptor 3 [Phycodurus eques]|uniref:LOW QUALITY PROTEIN: proteinase-activated receptor 3 n=1 Tax=Phycodurus eques TaxID=693459 RepID=UPI002ACE1673|nr:LOW QUALITY PROTEIN: proteinase-activated receptor 3 [Phycodurus eques]